jgi:uncharacterized protein (TIGR02145 family)
VGKQKREGELNMKTQNQFKSIFSATIIAVLLSVVSCDAANNPSALVGRWVGKDMDMELFKDGTGVCDGVGISWKVENKRLVVLSPILGFASDYEVSSYRLTLTEGSKKVKYVNINNKKYPQKGTITDSRNGKKYGTIEIGHQIWLSENLNYDAEGSKCYENNASNCDKYGRLYDWNMALKACPNGWHLPSDEEWQELVDFAGGEKRAGERLKAKDAKGTGEFGFSALPGGYGNSIGSFDDVGSYGYWWSATEGNASNAWYRYMDYLSADVFRNLNDKSYLYSVRCAQD